MRRNTLLIALAAFAAGAGAGYFAPRFPLRAPSPEIRPVPERVTRWGEHYFDLADGVNSLEATLNLRGLEELFGARFDVDTPFYVNELSSIACCPVPFRGGIYYVTSPLYVGSFNNTVFGYDFYIRKPGGMSPDTDTRVSVLFDHHRRIVSVTFGGDVFGGGIQQIFVDAEALEPAVLLASSVRKAMARALKGDGSSDPHWSGMPNFMEKFIVAVDNHVLRN